MSQKEQETFEFDEVSWDDDLYSEASSSESESGLLKGLTTPQQVNIAKEFVKAQNEHILSVCKSSYITFFVWISSCLLENDSVVHNPKFFISVWSAYKKLFLLFAKCDKNEQFHTDFYYVHFVPETTRLATQFGSIDNKFPYTVSIIYDTLREEWTGCTGLPYCNKPDHEKWAPSKDESPTSSAHAQAAARAPIPTQEEDSQWP